MRRQRPLLGIGVALALSGAALGVPPPRADPDPIEPHGFIDPCTVNNHEEMHVDCVFCDATQAPPCKERFGSKAYVKKCQTRAGHAGPTGEVWCLDRRPQPSSPEPANGLAIAGSVAFVGALAAAGYYLRRRRRTP